jgi:hypothetical protein
MDICLGLLAVGMVTSLALYCGLVEIASAIRRREVNVKLPPIEVHHRHIKED